MYVCLNVKVARRLAFAWAAARTPRGDNRAAALVASEALFDVVTSVLLSQTFEMLRL